MEGNNTIIYDQLVAFETFDSEVDIRNVLLDPFEDTALNFFLRERLIASNDAFANLPNGEIAPALLPADEPSEEEDDEFSFALIIGIGVAGAAVVAFLLLVLFRCSFGRRKNKFVPTPDQQPAQSRFSVQDSDEPDIRKPLDPRLSRSLDDSLGYGDQSVNTMEYDYAKAFGGGMADRSVASSASGAKHKNSILAEMMDLEGSPSALGSRPEEDVDDGMPLIKSETYHVNAPPGKLGVVIDTPDNGPPVVHAVKDSSVLFDQIHVGDKLMKVDDEDVTTMTAVRVSKLISHKSANEIRKLTLRRDVVMD